MAQRSPGKPAGEPGAATFVSYVRVSTDAQGASGLGLEAQREAINRHVAASGGRLVAEFQEIESGKKNDRPEIARALAACRARRATLVIAKLDRLARNVSFVSNLMESGADFVACDNPHATRLTIHILAAVAEHEREMISGRTKAALAAVRASIAATGAWTSRVSGRTITSLGNPNPKGGSRAQARHAARAASENAGRRAADIAPYIDAARKAGCTTLGLIAGALTARGIRTPGGCFTWSAEQVRRIIARNGTSQNASAPRV
jgi:DNA invertase Pin-like site-specific DNA recombinase